MINFADLPLEELIMTWGAKLVAALLILIIGNWIAKRVAAVFVAVMNRNEIDVTLTKFLKNIIYYALLTAVVIAAAGQLGINTTSFLTVVGAAGLAVGLEGFPTISTRGWLIIAWLAVVNTALAFTLWNHSLVTLSATESSLINNTMLVQIALLAWLFLGETPTARQILGMAAALIGVVLVNLPKRKKPAEE